MTKAKGGMAFLTEGLSAITKFAEDMIDEHDEEDDAPSFSSQPRVKRTSPLSQFQKNLIAIEYSNLHENLPSGMYVVPSLHREDVWYGNVFLREGPYAGGVFPFRLTIPKSYPFLPASIVPKVQFHTSCLPFHPQVDRKTGQLLILQAFPVWKPFQNQLWHVLSFVKKSFHSFNDKPMANEEASKTYVEDQGTFQVRALQSARDSGAFLFDQINQEDCLLQFSPWNEDIHPQFLETVLRQQQQLEEKDQQPISSNL